MTKASDLAVEGEMLEALMKDYYEQQKRTTTRTSKGKRPQKSGFKARFVLFPLSWATRLRKANVGSATYHLAIAVLIEKFKLDQMAVKEIVLSQQVTGLSPVARRNAINILARLKLIRIKRAVGKAVRVSELYYL